MAETVEIGDVVKAGILDKEGHVFHTWKQRWFELTSDGMLCYYAADKEKLGPSGELLGAIFLNGATIDHQPPSMRSKGSKRPLVVIRTQQAKSFPLKPPPSCPSPDTYLAEWVAALSEYAAMPYRPPRLVLSRFDPPPLLGDSPVDMTTTEFLSLQQVAVALFSVRAGPVKKERLRFKIVSSASLPEIASRTVSGKVTRSMAELTALRNELAELLPQILLPPLVVHHVGSFLQRLACDPKVRLLPEFHEFLDLPGTFQRDRKRELLAARKEGQQRLDTLLSYSRGGLFSREIAPLYPDGLFALLPPLASHLSLLDDRLSRARSCFLKSRDRDTGALRKRADDVKAAMSSLKEVNPGLAVLASSLGDCMDEVCLIQEAATKEVSIDTGLEAASQMIEHSKALIDQRRVRLLSYQASIAKANDEKTKLADKITHPQLAQPKPDGRSAFGYLISPSNSELPKQIKLQEIKVVSAQQTIQDARAELHDYSTTFADAVRNQEQWLAIDFKNVCFIHKDQKRERERERESQTDLNSFIHSKKRCSKLMLYNKSRHWRRWPVLGSNS